MSQTKSKTFKELQAEVHKTSKDHGWWEDVPTFPEHIALVHSELSEALEEYRDGMEICAVTIENDKPRGIPTELADVVIRVMDICEWYGIDLEQEIIDKNEFNKQRPHKHGGKIL